MRLADFSGMTDLHRLLERKVAEFLAGKTLCFSTVDLAARSEQFQDCSAKRMSPCSITART